MYPHSAQPAGIATAATAHGRSALNQSLTSAPGRDGHGQPEGAAHLVGGRPETGQWRPASDQEMCRPNGPVVASGLGGGTPHHVGGFGCPGLTGGSASTGSRFLVRWYGLDWSCAARDSLTPPMNMTKSRSWRRPTPMVPSASTHPSSSRVTARSRCSSSTAECPSSAASRPARTRSRARKSTGSSSVIDTLTPQSPNIAWPTQRIRRTLRRATAHLAQRRSVLLGWPAACARFGQYAPAGQLCECVATVTEPRRHR
jgi:hypothetical protein